MLHVVVARVQPHPDEGANEVHPEGDHQADHNPIAETHQSSSATFVAHVSAHSSEVVRRRGRGGFGGSGAALPGRAPNPARHHGERQHRHHPSSSRARRARGFFAFPLGLKGPLRARGS